MSSKTVTDRLTPEQRFARGLKYSAAGPVDVTRGAVGLGLSSAQSSASWLGSHYRAERERRAGGSRHGIGRRSRGRRRPPRGVREGAAIKARPRPLVLALAGAAVLGVGAVTFSIVRRSTQPDPSPRAARASRSPRP